LAIDFKTLYCAHFALPEELYAKKVFFDSVFPISAPLTRLAYCIRPSWFQVDFIILEKLGSFTNFNEFREEAELTGFRYRKAKDFHFFRRGLKMRLSSRRLLRLGANLWQEQLNAMHQSMQEQDPQALTWNL
jgi:hypothetical protein